MVTRAAARLATGLVTRAGRPPSSRLDVLRRDWPLMLRPTELIDQPTTAAWASRDATPAVVHVAAGAAGPLGGDLLRLDVHVGAGSALVLGEISPTLLLPGPRGERSRIEIDISVGAGATLAWFPELVIAAHRCDHRTDVRIALEPDARLAVREEILFGRHGEQPGTLRQRLRIVRAGHPVYDQELTAGPEDTGWDGPAVTGGHRSVGTLVVVPGDHPECGAAEVGPDVASMELPGGGVAVSTVAADTTTVHRRLGTAWTRIAGTGSCGFSRPRPGSAGSAGF